MKFCKRFRTHLCIAKPLYSLRRDLLGFDPRLPAS